MVTINVRTHMPSGNINTVTFKINLYTQWLSEYGYMNMVIIEIHTLRPVAISV